MLKGSTNIPPSGMTSASHSEDTMLETSTQNIFMPDMPDIPEDLDMMEV